MKARPAGREAQALRLLCLPGARASGGLSLELCTIISAPSSSCAWRAW